MAPRLNASPGCARDEALDVVGERDDAGRDVQVERVERAPGALGARLQMVQEHVSVLGHEGRAEPAVGHLAVISRLRGERVAR